MNYLTEQRKNALAAEYVLGTLQGRARIRFQKLLMQHQPLREALWAWESHLNSLGGSLSSTAPDPVVWEKIQARLGFNPVAANDGENLTPQNATILTSATPTINNVATYWQWLAALSSAAAVVLAIALVWPTTIAPVAPPVATKPPQITTPPISAPTAVQTQVAVVQSAKAEALWLISLDDNNLKIQATALLPTQANNDYELWIVAKDGRAPISLGVMPQQGQLVVPRSALFDELEIAVLAVSLEPVGGSPNGSPTTVLYSAQLLSI